MRHFLRFRRFSNLKIFIADALARAATVISETSSSDLIRCSQKEWRRFATQESVSLLGSNLGSTTY